VVSLVPAGLVARVEAGETPGTPHPLSLSPEARAALHRLDSGTGNAADLETVLSELHRPADFVTLRRESGITLWHLLQRVSPDLRPAVYRRLAALSPPPESITRDGVLQLDRDMLDRWRRDLNPMWAEEAGGWATRMVRRLWETVM
jgi:hypothetical protein